MPERERYLLQIWRSRAVAGQQWVARVDRLSDGDRHRFTDPEVLLEHVRALVEAASPDREPQVKGPP